MKKLLSVVVAVVLIITALPLTSLNLTASAASYPTIMYDKSSSTPTIIKGQAGYLHFTIFTEYENEKYTVEIYDEDNNICASVSDTYYNSTYNSTYLKELTVTINTRDLDMEVGKYTVVYYVGYYTFFEWREAPNKYEATLEIISNKCNGKHNFKKTFTYSGSCSYKGRNEMTCSKCGHIKYEETDYEHELSLEDGKLVCSESFCDYVETRPTLFKVKGVLTYFKNGVFKNVTGLVKNTDGNKYYVKNGKVVNTTGLLNHKGKLYYLKKGKLYTEPTLVKYKGTFYYYKNGVKNTSNTLVKFQGKWYHVKNGKRVYDTTLVKYDGNFYYVKNGIKNQSNTLCKFNGKLYHVKGGKRVYDTAIVKYNNKRYYVKNGIAQLTVTQKVKVAGKWYNVRKGIVK